MSLCGYGLKVAATEPVFNTPSFCSMPPTHVTVDVSALSAQTTHRVAAALRRVTTGTTARPGAVGVIAKALIRFVLLCLLEQIFL